MRCSTSLVALSSILVAASTLHLPGVSAAQHQLSLDHDYRDVHSYPSETEFSELHGWKRIVVSDLKYKYPNQTRRPSSPVSAPVRVQVGDGDAQANELHHAPLLPTRPHHPHPPHRYHTRPYHRYPKPFGRVIVLGRDQPSSLAARRVFANETTLGQRQVDYDAYGEDDDDDEEHDMTPVGIARRAAKKKATSLKKNKNKSNKPKKISSKTKAKAVSNTKTSVTDAAVGGVLGQALKGIGELSKVVITWYTGNDLKNPSCWSDGSWTPTDESFVCALTLKGWTNRPSCFSFLELCNGPSKCIFVRVVDTCAGCAEGSHHVDLTQAAFKKLASLDTGILNVNMRLASLPESAPWDISLWGPKAKN